MIEAEQATKHLQLKLMTIKQRIVEQRKYILVLNTKVTDSEVAVAKAERRLEVLTKIGGDTLSELSFLKVRFCSLFPYVLLVLG